MSANEDILRQIRDLLKERNELDAVYCREFATRLTGICAEIYGVRLAVENRRTEDASPVYPYVYPPGVSISSKG